MQELTPILMNGAGRRRGGLPLRRQARRLGLAMLALACRALSVPAEQADDAAFLARVQADTAWLAGYGTRQVGTPSHARLQDDLLAKLRAIPGVRIWTHTFPVVVPVSDEASLEIAGGALPGKHPLLPVWPDVARLNTTPPGGIQGRLLYVGNADLAGLPARGLAGSIAVMEMSAYAQYRRVFDSGAAAVLLLESSEPERPLPARQSLYKPRFYVPAGPLADALRAGRIADGRITSCGRWQTVMARNVYAAVAPAAVTGVPPYAVVAPYDSMSRVMGAAPGADAALDCAVVLNVLREEAQAPSRPLLFGFLDACHINQLGMRHMAAMLTITPDERTRGAYDRLEQADLETYRATLAELDRFRSADEGLEALHDRQACKRIRRMFKDALGPDLLQLNEIQGDLRLASLRLDTEQTPAMRLSMLAALDHGATRLLENHRGELAPAELAELESTLAFVVTERTRDETAAWASFQEGRDRARRMLPICEGPIRARNRILEAVYSASKPVDPAYLKVARELWRRMDQRVRGQCAEQEERRAFFEPMDRIRREMTDAFGLGGGAGGGDAAGCTFVVGLDLSDCGILVGPGGTCAYNRIETLDRTFARALKGAVKGGVLWQDPSMRRAVNVTGIELGRPGGQGDRHLITSAALSFLLPGVTWVTDDALRLDADSPLDRYGRMDWGRVAPQLPPTRAFLRWLFTTRDFVSKPRSVAETAASWRHGMGRVVDASAGETVPRVPRRGFLVTLTGNGLDTDGIRRQEFAWTGQDGTFRLPLLCGEVFVSLKALNVTAVRLDEAARIVESLSTTESLVTARLATTFDLGTAPGEQLPRAVTFACTELNGPSFFDARFLEPLSQGLLQDAVRGGAPKQAHFSVSTDGQMWGLVEPEIRWQLILRAGAARVRMALLNAIPDGRGRGLSLRDVFQRGFAVAEPLPTIPQRVAATDLATLDAWRLADFREAGIRSAKIDEIRQSTDRALAAAAEAEGRDDGAALHRHSEEALANEIRAYQAVKDLGLDIVRGAIFLMLMLVPFSVAMERLIFAFSRIGHQIGAAVAIFGLMSAMLWSFHPAFRISAQPLVIVMAFTILSMSVVVISMVLRRFQASVREFQSSKAEGSGASMSRGGLVGSAVFLGIANMRKRKVRTLLTGTTIVLVTFALLCFSSASSYVDRRDVRLRNVQAPPAASVLVRRPTFGPLSWEAAPALRNLLGGSEADVGERVWLVGGLGDDRWRLQVINPGTGTLAPVRGLLGLPAIEDRLSGVGRVLPDWPTFAAEGGCYLSRDTAARLAVSPGDTVVLRGVDLVVRGVFDPVKLEDDVALLDGQRITPYDYSQLEQDWINRDSQDAIEQETGSATAMQPEGDPASRHIPGQELIVVPSGLARTLGGSLRSFGIACQSAEQAAEVADRLTRTIVYPAYYVNRDGGVSVLASSPLIAVPPRNLAIPLVIAALIIFSTMLNSVSERRSEIYVYSSLGLAPAHVGALFVAEALTYGLMGAVFGYIAGQGSAALLTQLGWMHGVTLNYSGTAVIRTMLLVQAVVVLSAVVPAMVAGRIAAPSKEMTWRVPQPVDGVIRDSLPFTVSPDAAAGLVAFMHEYLEAHRDGVLGAFDVDQIRLLPAGTPGTIAGLEARLWLEPFDMGVRQWMRLTVTPPDDGACAILAEIRHEAGTPKVWWRLNRPFFVHLRRQLLGWRKLSPERIRGYVAATCQMPVIP